MSFINRYGPMPGSVAAIEAAAANDPRIAEAFCCHSEWAGEEIVFFREVNGFNGDESVMDGVCQRIDNERPICASFLVVSPFHMPRRVPEIVVAPPKPDPWIVRLAWRLALAWRRWRR